MIVQSNKFGFFLTTVVTKLKWSTRPTSFGFFLTSAVTEMINQSNKFYFFLTLVVTKLGWSTSPAIPDVLLKTLPSTNRMLKQFQHWFTSWSTKAADMIFIRANPKIPSTLIVKSFIPEFLKGNGYTVGFSPFPPRETTFVTSCLFYCTSSTFWKLVSTKKEFYLPGSKERILSPREQFFFQKGQ